MSRKTNSHTAIACELAKYDPRRRVDWRWLLAARPSISAPDEHPELVDPLLGRAVEFRQKLARCNTPARRARLKREEPDLFMAHDLYINGGWNRALVEARILARVPIPEIAQRFDLTEQAVELFAGLFFDVADRMQSPDWILNAAIGNSQRAKTALAFAECQIRYYAYFMGPAMLLEEVFDEQGRARTDLPDTSTAAGRRAVRARFMVDLARPGKDAFY